MANGTRCGWSTPIFGLVGPSTQINLRRSNFGGSNHCRSVLRHHGRPSCNRLLPSTLCNALPNCLLKLTDGRQVEGHSDVITTAVNPISVQSTIKPLQASRMRTTSMHDQYTPILDGGGIRVDSDDSRLSERHSRPVRTAFKMEMRVMLIAAAHVSLATSTPVAVMSRTVRVDTALI